MNFEITGKCKQCGAELRVFLSADDYADSICQIARCPHCRHQIDSGDTERLRHLLDTFATTDARNDFISFSNVVIYR